MRRQDPEASTKANRLFLIAIFSLGGLTTNFFFILTFLIAEGQAQIVPDATLPVNSSVKQQGNTSIIEGGTRAGSNLFHSFREFSVRTGTDALFDNRSDIRNILTRVTGNSISNIDGLIKANGTANLFLLNPNGIIFGPNARLNIGGSFLATTASSLIFSDGTKFSATNPQASPLLTINVPVGLQFGPNPGQIVNQAGVAAVLPNPLLKAEEPGLEVHRGKSIALLGGEVIFDGGIITALGGRVELGGIAGEGTVGLVVDSNNLSLSFPNDVERANVSLVNGSLINVKDAGGGSIAVNARNLNVENSSFSAGIAKGLGTVNSKAGDIEINATETVSFYWVDSNPDTFINSITGAFNGVAAEGAGTAGNVTVIAGGSVSLRNGAQLFAGTEGNGSAGRVTIKARDTVSFDGVNNGIASGAFSGVNTGAVGDGKGIEIETGSLRLTNGAGLFASTYGKGNGGKIIIKARDTVSFDGVNGENPSGVFSSVEKEAIGNGGNIEIEAGSLTISNGARLSSFTKGQGNAGSVKITARNTVLFDGVDSDGKPSGAFSTVEEGAVVDAGGISITTKSFSLTNSAGLTASNKGNGTAGEIKVVADSILLDNKAEIRSDTQGNQGNIELRSPLLILRNGSKITTNGTKKATGGNINLILENGVFAALEDSDINANSDGSLGGKIAIKAISIFKTQDSDITVKGGNPDLSGSLDIDTNVTPQVIQLADNFQEVSLVASRCRSRESEQSEFIITGRGGLPLNPIEAIADEATWMDLRVSVAEQRSTGVSPVSARENRQLSTTTPEIVEAQGWLTNSDGQVELVAKVPTATPSSPTFRIQDCDEL